MSSNPALTTSPVAGTPAARSAARWKHLLNLPNVLTLCFLIVCGIFIFNHALWIDEAQAFVIARDSPSLSALFVNLRYEGHPPLWHILLWGITRFTTRVQAMQALHLLLAGTSVYLVARFAPFPAPAKILFAFGYFPLFEYGIISRNYQLVMLLTFVFCALWQQRRGAYLWLGVTLALLCLSHVMGVIIGAGLGMALLLEAVCTRDGRAAIGRRPVRFVLAVLIAGGGAALSVKLLAPPPDSGYATGWDFLWNWPHFVKTLSILRDGIMPIPAWRVHFWDGHMIATTVFAAKCGCALALGGLLCIGLSWRAVVFYLISIAGQCAFSYVKFFGGVRHHGGLFVTLIAALWIAWGIPARLPASAAIWRRIFLHIGQGALIVLLAVQVYSAAVACYFAWQVPFAAGRAAGLALRQTLRPEDVLVASSEFVAPSLAVYVPGRTFIFPSTHRSGTFIIWRGSGAWEESSVGAAERIVLEKRRPVVWVTREPLVRLPRNAVEIGVFDSGGDTLGTAKAIVEMERYAIYRFNPPQASPQ